MRLKVEVKAAKTRWIEKMVAGINGATTGQGGSAECWALVRKLQQGLDRSVSNHRPGSSRTQFRNFSLAFTCLGSWGVPPYI